LFAFPATTPADAVYLKDGFTLHGKVRREADLMTDPLTGQMIPVIKGSNFFIVDDRVRWVIFGHRGVQDADPDVNSRGDFLEFTYPLSGTKPNSLPKSARLDRITPINDNWQRTVFLRNEMGQYTIRQRLTALTPYAARIESNIYQWNVFYQTAELGQDTVRRLLATHPQLKEEGAPDIEKRMKKFRFLLQAGWLLAAEEELDKAFKDLPQEKDRLDRARVTLRQAQSRSMWDEVETANRAGRNSYVRDILNRMPTAELDSRLAIDVASLKAKYDTWDRQTSEARRLLDVTTGMVVGPPRRVFAEAVPLIRADAGPDTLERLEAFMPIAAQLEQEVKSGRTPSYAAEDVLALAVTGWVLGRESAEPAVAAAERLWAGREFALNYLKTHDAGVRRRDLDTYQKQNPLNINEIAQLVALLPPPEPADATGPLPTGYEERVAQVPWSQNKPVNFVLQLPPEYRPTRSYPLLIVLHAAGERPAEALTAWSFQAARHGYILAAPQWSSGGGGYNYSTEEHNAVVELVKDLRRRYAVDSDRVLLTGYGDGGTMAFDVALSHPDLFAGVVPVNGRPRKSASTWYWRNAQYLPFYIVAGEMAGDTCSLDRFLFENWMSRGYPSLMTIYKGRPMEFYPAELPFVFDWMNRKKRATGFPDLGRNPNAGNNSEEFQTMRAGDNHFYWLSVESINEKYVNHEIGRKIGSPAALQAQIRENNQIFINTRGIKHLRVWLGRTWDAQAGSKAMVDFDKPVKITINRAVLGGKERKITPSLTTMLEDLYQRGDRQRLFMAYLDATNLQ
jgi:pimeloyl-ACP methyl ester carboxylesterase